MMKKLKKQASRTDKEYETLGRMLVSFYESNYISHKKAYKVSFVKGIFTGLGTVIGATIVVTILIFVLSFFKQIPLIGHFADKVRSSIEVTR
jgi:hypothetical protein